MSVRWAAIAGVITVGALAFRAFWLGDVPVALALFLITLGISLLVDTWQD